MLNAEIHLEAKGLRDTIKKEKQASSQAKAKAMTFVCHHLHKWLKSEYLTVKDPLELWTNLKERYDCQSTGLELAASGCTWDYKITRF